MTPINFIATTLPPLPPDVRKLLQPQATRCSFTGLPITEGIPVGSVVSDVFTDWANLRYRTGWVSEDAAKCIMPIIQGRVGLNALRNYSFLSTEQETKLLDNPSAMEAVLNPPTGQFVLAVTFSNKKHLAYKALLNGTQDGFWVTTDVGAVQVWKRDLEILMPLLRSWYAVLPGKEGGSTQPTYFTKKQILEGLQISSLKQVEAYGPERYMREDAVLQQYRGALLLELLVYLLSKSFNHGS